MRPDGKYGGHVYLPLWPRWVVRRGLAGRRGLAEIVGTLMLVLIVVAAAVAFSFFVASYESQLTNEERAAHDRQLESVRVVSISETGGGVYLTLHLASGDVNWMNLTGYAVNGAEVPLWTYQPSGGGLESCSWPSNVSTCTELAPLSDAVVNLSGFGILTLSEVVHLDVFTKLSNEFGFLFLPPVAIEKASIIPIGNQSEPLFDGSPSYVPVGGDNASIASYVWTMRPSFREITGNVTVNPSQPDKVVDLNFSTANPASVLGPIAGTPPFDDSACAESVCFDEFNLPNDTRWSVFVNSGFYGPYTIDSRNASGGQINVTLAAATYPYEAFVSAPSPFGYYGPQVEVYQLSSVPPTEAVYWSVSLTVTDTDGLTNTTSVVYQT